MKKVHVLRPLNLILLIALAGIARATEKSVYEQFGKQIEQTLANNHPGYLNKLFDLPAFAKLVMAIDSTDTYNEFDEGFRTGLLSGFDFSSELTGQIRQGAWYAFLRHYEDKGIHHLVFRQYTQGGINYHDFELIEKEGALRIADVYIYYTGENISNTISRIYLSYKLKANQGKALSNNRNRYFNQILKIQEIKELLNVGNARKALKVFNSVPREF